MIHFPDTSFLCALYRTQIHSTSADQYIAKLNDPLMVSSLLLLEFRQSVRLQTWLYLKDKNKGFSQEQGELMLHDLENDIKSGFLVTTPLDWPGVHQQAEELSHIHTVSNGHRLTDIIHVASAIHLGVTHFLTFDHNQKKLAQAEGLIVPF
jgi:predicted nucleic acid-binding protein